jgi:hypothetical protein
MMWIALSAERPVDGWLATGRIQGSCLLAASSTLDMLALTSSAVFSAISARFPDDGCLGGDSSVRFEFADHHS